MLTEKELNQLIADTQCIKQQSFEYLAPYAIQVPIEYWPATELDNPILNPIAFKSAAKAVAPTVGQVMGICQQAMSGGATMAQCNQYCIDEYGLSYGYLLYLQMILVGISSFNHSDYSFYYNIPISNM